MARRSLRDNCFGAELRFGLGMLLFVVFAKATTPKSSMKVSATAPLMALNLFFILLLLRINTCLVILMLLRRGLNHPAFKRPDESQLPASLKGKERAAFERS
jgi:hypothetical protein